jgi:hypothetical protein
MGNGNQPSAEEHSDAEQRLSGQDDRRNQLARTLQWDADGMHLLRPAAFHSLMVMDRFYGTRGE